MIYESRPNVTVDAAALPQANAHFARRLRAFLSNQAIAKCVTSGITAADLPASVQLVATTDRTAVGEL